MRFYFALAVKDVFRLWSATQLQVVIIAGICLPILMLLGLKNGHVAELRRDLETSPTGRRIIFYTGTKGDFITDQMIADIENDIASVDVIIPKLWKDLSVRTLGDNPTPNEARSLPITLHATVPRDPLLNQLELSIDQEKPLDIFISENVADQTGTTVGDKLVLQLVREIDPNEGKERHELTADIAGIVPQAGNESGNIGYANLGLLQKMEEFVRGQAVPDWNVAVSSALRAANEYGTYLLITFSSEDLQQKDFDFLTSRDLIASEITESEIKSLFGILNRDTLDDIKIYRLIPKESNQDNFIPILDSPETIERYTSPVDDFVVFWSDPIDITIRNQSARLVGVTLPDPDSRQNGAWIGNYLAKDAPCFTYDENLNEPLAVRMPPPTQSLFESERLELVTDTTKNNRIIVRNDSARPAEQPSTANNDDESTLLDDAAQPESKPDIITPQQESNRTTESQNPHTPNVHTLFAPSSLLAYLDQHRRGKVQFEPLGSRFISVPLPIDYTQASLFAKTIDDVPLATELLADRNYIYRAESSRIKEIQTQTHSLEILVYVVAIGVFIFGVITVFSVLVDSTERKKGAIGIFRVMGVSRMGVFSILLFRAIVIGLLAAVFCALIGGAVTLLLSGTLLHAQISWIPSIKVILTPRDYLLVGMGGILCACLGVIIPAVKASRLDPFEAIMQGQFK